MLKLLLKKKFKKLYFKNLINFYKKYLLENYFFNNIKLYKSTIQISLPKRQHYTTVLLDAYKRVYSTGLILSISNIKLKYYKRSHRSNTGHILFLQNTYLTAIKHLYLYYVLNFNFRQWIFFNKFLTLVNPNILILQHKKSYNTCYRPVKRLKRRVLKVLLNK